MKRTAVKTLILTKLIAIEDADAVNFDSGQDKEK